MQPLKALLAISLAALLVPAAVAQTPSTDLTFDGGDSITIATSGATTLNFTASLGCGAFLDQETVVGGGSLTRTVTFGYPEGITGPETLDITFDGAPCVEAAGQGSVDSAEQTIDVTPGVATPGKTPLEVTLTSGDATGAIDFEVDYRAGYVFDHSSQAFPITVTQDEEGEWIPVSWTVTLAMTPNADTMVMMLVDEKAQFGGVAGLFSNAPFIFKDLTTEQLTNGFTQTATFSYTPTSEDWMEDSVTVTTWSHWLGDGNMKSADDQVTWTFVNGEYEEGGSGKGIPGFGTGLSALALLGAAMVAARRS